MIFVPKISCETNWNEKLEQILEVVANTKVKCLRAEVRKGFVKVYYITSKSILKFKETPSTVH